LRESARLRIVWPTRLAGVSADTPSFKQMMAENNLTEEERLQLQSQIDRLRQEHRDLDTAIDALSDSGQADRLQIQRLKKRKLHLRDKLQALEDELTPDIIA